jgi:hypothetical protein
MGRPPRPDLRPRKVELAGLIDAALKNRRRPAGDPNVGRDWSNAELGRKIYNRDDIGADVAGWRNQENPTRPNHIVPILRYVYGLEIPAGVDVVDAVFEYRGSHANEVREIYRAWRAAGGTDGDDARLRPQTIEPVEFHSIANVVNLEISQPVALNDGSRSIGITVRIHPDTETPAVAGHAVDLGIRGSGEARPAAGPLLVVESSDWQPASETVFRDGEHPTVASVALPGAVRLVGPIDGLGRIDGHPLRGAPKFIAQPRHDGAAGDISFEVSVADRWRSDDDTPSAFIVTRRDGKPVNDTQKAVLDALFSPAFPRKHGRLVVARTTVKAGGVKTPE